MDQKTEIMIALGVAIGVNCIPCFDHLYSRSQEVKLAQHQMSVCVQNQMLLLPENYRTVVWLFDVLGFTLKETAEILELSVENVKIRLHRARKKLKYILNRNCLFKKDERNVLVCEPKSGVNWQGDTADSGNGLMDFAKNTSNGKTNNAF